MQTNGIEHVALTVPDIEAATSFFVQAFAAEIMFDGHKPEDGPVAGEAMEKVFGMPSGGCWIWRRLLNVGGSYLELFQYEHTSHQRAPHTYDYGITHFAVHVDDLAQSVHDVEEAGGHAYRVYDSVTGQAVPARSAQGWCYVETPWGSVIELVTFPTI